jgi:HTH-like domain
VDALRNNDPLTAEISEVDARRLSHNTIHKDRSPFQQQAWTTSRDEFARRSAACSQSRAWRSPGARIEIERRPRRRRARSPTLGSLTLRATVGTPDGMCGRPKMTAHLRRQGHRVAACTVDRLMGDEGLSGVFRGRTTFAGGKDPRRAPDLLDRDFTAAVPNRR